MLTLTEELVLLTIHEDKCTFIKWTSDRIKPGLVGATLVELALAGKIQASDKHRLVLPDAQQPEDERLEDERLYATLEALKDSEKERKFGYWINALTKKPVKTRQQLTESLVEKGILTQEDEHLEWAIPSPLQSEVQASTKFWVKRRLRGIVLSQEAAELRDIALLSLLRACYLLDLVFLKDERRLANRQIKELLVSAAMNDPLTQTIEEIGAAIAVVVEDD